MNLAVGTLARVESTRTHCRQMNAAYSDCTVRSLGGSSLNIRVRRWKPVKRKRTLDSSEIAVEWVVSVLLELVGAASA